MKMSDTPMDSEDLVMLHVFEDSHTKTMYSTVTLGPFLRCVREAQALIARLADIPAVRLQGVSHLHLDEVFASETRVESRTLTAVLR